MAEHVLGMIVASMGLTGLASYVSKQCHELVECFFLLLRSTRSATAKFIATVKLNEIICCAGNVIFHVHLIQIYFESRY